MPVLWDTQTKMIVNNESSEIIRMFNTAFNDQLAADKAALDLYPEELRAEIDDVNSWVYDTVNSASTSPRPTCPSHVGPRSLQFDTLAHIH